MQIFYGIHFMTGNRSLTHFNSHCYAPGMNTQYLSPPLKGEMIFSHQLFLSGVAF